MLRCVLVAVGGSAAGLAIGVSPTAAADVACPNIPLEERVANVDAAFVGRLQQIRPVAGATVSRFDVRQKVKGPVAGLVEVRSDEPLTDSKGKALPVGTAVGVLADLDGATLVTSSCLVTTRLRCWRPPTSPAAARSRS